MEDAEKFGSSLFNKNLKTLGYSESKKKVMFKDFDDSDPLEDLNPFEDDFKESLKQNTDIAKDNKIENLFGIKRDKKSDVKDSVVIDSSIIDNTVAKKSPLLPIREPLKKLQSQESILKESDFLQSQRNIPKMKSVLDSNNDSTFNLNENNKTHVVNQAKKSLLIEDLFGNKSRSTVSTFDTSKDRDISSFNLSTTNSNPRESLTGLNYESTKKTSTESGFSLSASKEPRRGRRSTVPSDPLGLFSTSNSQIDEAIKIEDKSNPPLIAEANIKTVDLEELPEWLGGPKVRKEQKQEAVKTDRNEVLSNEKLTEAGNKIPNSTNYQVPILGNESTDQSNLTSKLLSMEFDQQAAIINMQQQEHELRTAAAFSQQNQKLNYLLETQKIKLSEQEKQFNMLIARQLERQSTLEAQMKSQQDRIDSYIQTLAAQPTTIPMICQQKYLPVKNEAKINAEEDTDEKEESEYLLQKLQLEKLYLENIVDSLREKHEKEISILEDSYKKQISFLEEAMVQMEKRMQDEVECLDTDYKLKIQKLKEEIIELERVHKIEKDIIKEDNSTLIQELHQNHSTNLEIMQKEHTEIIQRITNCKESERKAIEIMTIDGRNVENVLNKSQLIIENLEDLQKKIVSKESNFVESQSNHLIVEKENIKYLKDLLEAQKDTFTKEKEKLMAAVQKLELDFSELMKEFRQQNAAFKESHEIMKSKEQGLLRDREIFVEQTKWERERLQAIRDEWAKEQNVQLSWLAQERQILIAERGKLQIFNRLKTETDESSKIELEATIKAAQAAMEKANQERLKWQEKISQLEKQENALQDQENSLVQIAKELKVSMQTALAKKKEGMCALEEARFIQERYKDKFNEMQTQQENLLQRENKLATEKLDLARNRLSYRVSDDIEKPVKDTAFMDDNKSSREDIFSFSEMPSYSKNSSYYKDIVDPNVVMLKWKLENNIDTSGNFPCTVIKQL